MDKSKFDLLSFGEVMNIIKDHSQEGEKSEMSR